MAVTAKPEISKILLDLGIEPVDVYAVDNAEKTYMSALIEGINTLEVANQGDSPRSRILRDELKALREKRRRVNVDKLFSRRSVSANRVNPKSLLPAAQEEDSQKQDFGRVNNILDAILKVISLDFKREKNQDRQDDKDEQIQRRINREKNLEKIKKSSLGVAKKLTSSLVKPFEDIIDRITNFLSATVIGYLINKVLSWFSDPNNKRKVEAIGRFVGNFYPALIALGLTLLSPVRLLIRGMVQTLAFAIPKLIALIAANPLASAAAATLVGGGLLLNNMLSKNKEVENLSKAQNQSTQKIIGGGEDTGDEEEGDTGDEKESGSGFSDVKAKPNMGTFTGDGFMKEFQGTVGFQEFNKGGKVPGSGNKDTVPAMLTPGEFIMSKGAVQKYGVDTLKSMNAAGGGTNIPTVMNQYSDDSETNTSTVMNQYSDDSETNMSTFMNEYSDGGLVNSLNLKKYSKGNLFNTVNNNRFNKSMKNITDNKFVKYFSEGGLVSNRSSSSSSNNFTDIQLDGTQIAANQGPSTPIKYYPDTGRFLPNRGGAGPGNIRPKGSAILASLLSLATGKGGSPYQEFEDPFKGKKFSPPPKDLPKQGDSPVKKATFIESILKEESTKGVPISPPIVSVNNQTIVLPAIKGRSKSKDTIQERESTLPYFDITTISPRRSMTLMALGLDSGLSVT